MNENFLISIKSQICYGIEFDEDFAFPWQGKNIEDWWIYDVLKYKDPVAADLNNIDFKKIDFFEINPLPVELVAVGSKNCCAYIIAAKDSLISVEEATTEVFIPCLLEVKVSEETKESLIDFCIKYLLPGNEIYFPTMSPQWYLSNYFDIATIDTP